MATTTTLPRAAVDVLNAIRQHHDHPPAGDHHHHPTAGAHDDRAGADDAPPPRRRRSAPFTATLVNEHTAGRRAERERPELPAGAGPDVDVELPISQRGDLVQVRLAEDDKCGVSDSGVIFQAGHATG